MLPTTLAISIAELRARTPFPSFLEAVLMESLLEIFQEAIIRLPKKIAGAAGVVGALVIGTTVVEAGLVNPLLVVVVATTAIASFTMPNYGYAMALRFLRVPMLFLASILGMYGVMLGYLAITVHMCSLKSFGESYLGSILDISLLSDWKDMLIRLPLRSLESRPEQYGAQEKKRTGDENG
ncbi:Spore germination protein B1 [bioreactor metagenome]|uniref:Spore germination protein B1 n=1 Tax=bioreactor metagenome TaxID=1076179 RepID=A0A645GAE2_9ZZZZ